MGERETPSSNQRQSARLSTFHDASAPPRLTPVFTVSLLFAYGFQLVSPELELWRHLALTRDGIEGGSLYRLLTHVYAYGSEASETLAYQLAGALQFSAALLLLGALCARLERRIGVARLALALFGLSLASGLTGLLWLLLCPQLGLAMTGPVALCLSLAGLHLFVAREETVLAGLPVPLAYVGGTVFLVLLAVARVVSAPSSSVVMSNAFAPLPSVLLGGLGWLIDIEFSRIRQRSRDKRELRLLMEEVGARARVEALLAKISSGGMASLTRRERRFLKRASRFYSGRQKFEG